jgi:hypothetical protein
MIKGPLSLIFPYISDFQSFMLNVSLLREQRMELFLFISA